MYGVVGVNRADRVVGVDGVNGLVERSKRKNGSKWSQGGEGKKVIVIPCHFAARLFYLNGGSITKRPSCFKLYLPM